MACTCDSPDERTYYANIQLFTDAKEGIPAGSARSLGMQQIIVCTKCGTAQFTIPEAERRWFRAA